MTDVVVFNTVYGNDNSQRQRNTLTQSDHDKGIEDFRPYSAPAQLPRRFEQKVHVQAWQSLDCKWQHNGQQRQHRRHTYSSHHIVSRTALSNRF